jgi:hypothetical protein
MDRQSEVFIFAHIPKTGGTTLDRHFETHMNLHVDYIPLSGPGERRAVAQGLAPFRERSLEDRQQAKVILGHQVRHNTHQLVPGKQPHYILLIREPISWITSRYNWAMRVRKERRQPIIKFDRWYQQTKRAQSQSLWFLRNFAEGHRFLRWVPPQFRVRQMNAIIQNFSMVTVTERLDEDGPLLMQRMGLPDRLERKNVAGVDHPKLLKVSDELKEKLSTDLSAEIRFYQDWKARSPLIQW